MKKLLPQGLFRLSFMAILWSLFSIQVAQAQCPNNGITWTSRTSAADNSWLSVTYGNGLFVAISNSGTSNSVMTSTDGISWTTRTTAANNAWWSVTYGNGVFVAVAASGTGNRVMTSPDGINWTIRSSAADNNWNSVTYGNGLFVAVANSGTNNRVMTSPDGISWTIRTSAANNDWLSVTYGNGLFVAVAQTGTGNRVMTSPDGISWTIRASAADNSWRSVTYGNGLFVAVALSGTGNRVMTSPNGINWTLRSSAADNQWLSVNYGNGLFVAVANTGTNNRVMTSPDGISWTIRSSAVDNQWWSVTQGNGVFVAVGNTGTGNRVMTSSSVTSVTPSVSIAANSDNSIATGTAVTFTATPTNGGSTPGYQWKKNGINVGTNSVTYSNAALANGDIITCVLSSSDACASPATATSNSITMTVYSAITPPVIVANGPTTFCNGGSVNLTAGNAAVSFNGTTTQYANLPALGITTNTLTMEAWVYANGTQNLSTGLIFARGGTTPASGLNFGLASASKIGYHWADNSSTYNWNGGPTYPLNTWFHVALVIEPTKATIYLNGVPYVNNVANAPVNFADVMQLAIDNAFAGRNFKGQMKEVRIWTTARTQAEVQSDITSTATSGTGLRAYYKLNESTGNTITDAAAVLGAGTLIGSPSRTAYNSYSWSPGGATTPSISATTSGTYTVTVTDANGATAVGSQAVTVDVIPLSAGTIAGAATVCQGQTGVTYTVPAITNATGYTWTLPTGAAITAGSNTNSITVSYSNAAISGNITVLGTSSCGNGTVSDNFAVTVNALPTTPTISGATEICAGSDTTLTTTATLGTNETYLWSDNSSSSSLRVSAANTYSLRIRNTVTSCTSAVSNAISVTVNTVPTFSSFSSTSTAINSILVITGTNLTGTSSVMFGETPARFSTNSNTQITATVPRVANTGKISLTKSTGCRSLSSSIPVTRQSSSNVFTSVNTWPNQIARDNICPTFTDLDSDGLLDMIVGDYVGFYHYEQSAANSTSFTLRTSDFTRGTLNAAPTFTDLDGDGRLDMVVGNINGDLERYEQSTTGSTSLTYLGYLDVYTGYGYNAKPTFTDLDADGLLDLVIGFEDGTLMHFEQSTANSASFTERSSNFNGIDVGSHSAPTFTDLDGDGLLDMLVGEYLGNINHYEQNTANSTSFTLVTANFNGICCRSKNTPTFTDLDGDGLLDLVTGGSPAFLSHYEQKQSPIISTLSANSVCVGATVSITGTSLTGATSVTINGTSVGALSGVTATNITFTVPATATSGNILVTTPNGTSNAVAMTINALPTTPTIFGATTFCSGGNVALTSSAGSSYLWSTGAITQSITVSASGSYTVRVTNANGCQSAVSAATTVTVNPLPLSAGTITGTAKVCQGQAGVTYTVPAITNATGYTWTLPTGAAITAGSNTNSITVSYSNLATSGNITVLGTNSCGNGTVSANFAVTVNALPTTPTITEGGATTFCSGGNVALTSSAGSSYLWSTGATTPSIEVSTAGDYTVTVTNAYGCSATSEVTVVTVNDVPLIPTITASGATTFCSGGNVVLTSSAGSNSLWSTGATTPSIEVSTAGDYTVTVTNAYGCSATSEVTTISVNALPVIPTITVSGDTTLCAGVPQLLSVTNPTLRAASIITSGIGASTTIGRSITVALCPNPMQSWWGGIRQQSLYTAAELTALGITNGAVLSSVAINLSAVETRVLQNYTVKMKNTTTTTFATTTFETGATTVRNAASYQPVVGWNTLALDSNFTYTGGSLIVEFTYSNGDSGGSGSNTATFDTTTNKATLYYRADGESAATVANVTTARFSETHRNNMQFGVLSASTTWSPTTGLFTDAAGTIAYTGGGTANVYAKVNSSTTYTATNVNTLGCTNSSTIAITVNDLPLIPTITASGDTTFCSGGSVALTASEGSSYLWSNGETTRSITATTGGDYTVTVTNAAGCSATSGTTTVLVKALPVIPTITVSGDTTFCSGGSVNLATRNAALSFNGTTQYADLPALGITTNTLTMEAWVYANGTQNLSSGLIFARGDTTPASGLNFGLASASKIGYHWANNSSTYNWTGGPTYPLNTWFHVALVIEPTKATIYLNGVPYVNNVANAPVNFADIMQLAIDNENCCGGRKFNGLMKEVKIWSTARTQAEVQSDITSTATNVNGVIAYYKLEENAGTSIADSSSNGNTGTLVGGPTWQVESQSYIWSNGETTPSITATTPGDYSVTVTNSNGCSSTSESTTIIVTSCAEIPTGQISGNATICSGTATQLSIALTGQGPWSGTLSDGTGFSGSDNPLLVTVTPSETTTYTIATLSSETATASAIDLSGSAAVTVNQPTIWYADADLDTYGDLSMSQLACEQPAGYVANNADCNPEDGTVWQLATFYVDADADGYNNGTASVCSGVGVPTGYSSTNAGADCNDNASWWTNNCDEFGGGSVVNLTLFIEGYYLGGNTMNSVRLNQDYVSSADEVEGISVSLHDATTYALVDFAFGMLKTDGTLSVTFGAAAAGSYYIAVKGVNLLQTWSAEPQAVGTEPLSYDFSSAATQAYGSNMREMETGVWAFYSGDINQDETVDNSDSDSLFSDIENSNFGVFATDLNGDGTVDNSDTDVFFINVENSIYSNHP